MQIDNKNETYMAIGAPLPIQNKDPTKTKALLNFVIEEPGELATMVKQTEQLNKINQRYFNSKKNIHRIGQSLSQLFKTPVYKSYQFLNTSNNEQFASCKLSENIKSSPQNTHNKLNEGILQFQSRFQSGNLAFASKSAQFSNQYFLALQRDINSESLTTQWFYFRVKNKQNTGIYTFNIVNFIKPFSTFKIGMKPCVYSVKQKKGWERACFNIQYRKNSIAYNQEKTYYSLSFSYQFNDPEDEIYFAYCYPYTYTRLQRFLDGVQAKHADKMRRKVVTKTLGNNSVQLISITNPQYLNKKLIFISGRVHPGETVSSYTCQAIIQYLLSSEPQAQKLRDQFIIKIIPMLNPDGVIHGNYRTSLSGHDLNRQWKNPDKISHPEIFHLKKLILESQYKKSLYIDIHGHSKKKSSFMYGCITPKSPYISKQIPYILSKQMQQFSYFSCNFSMPKSKEGTSRIVLFKNGIDYSYTYQLSFCGPIRQRRHYNIKDYETIGFQLCRTLSSYLYSRILLLQVDQILNKHCEEFYDDDQLMNFGNQQTDGSSSQLQDQTVKDQRKVKSPFKNKRTIKNHNATERSQLNNLLQGYLHKYDPKQRKDTSSRNEQIQIRFKKKVEDEIYIRQRQSFVATRVNIQQMSLQNQPFVSSMSTFYGLATEKNSNSKALEQVKSTSLKLNSRSFSYTQRKESQSFGVLLPNVQKNQYKRYERYKREKFEGGQKSASFFIESAVPMHQILQNKISSNRFSRGLKEITLVDRIRSRTNDRKDAKF